MNARSAPEKPRDAREMVRMAREFLTRKGVEEARLEGELLVAHALGLTRLELFMQLDRPVNDAEIDRARDFLVRRGRHEPVAYIIGKREFYGRSFAVGPAVLIPRPETELLIDAAREIAASHGPATAHDAAASRGLAAPFIADFGTGSGCIAITLALEIPGAEVIATDVSGAALALAHANAEVLGANIDLRESDGLGALASAVTERGRKLDILVSNPPYVSRDDARSLAPEVREHEPELALFAPAGDRDHWVRALLDAARDLLARDGVLLVELGADQGDRAAKLAAERGFRARLRRDLAGIARVLEARHAT
jgi:release factor glutamine methyltransferase